MFDRFKDHLEEKLEEIEEDMDEDDIPPWFGEKETSSDTASDTTSDTDSDTTSTRGEESTGQGQTVGDTFNVTEEEDEVTLQVEFPGYPKENLDVSSDDDYLQIAAEETENKQSRTYRYELPSDADVSGINAEYEYGVLTVRVPRN